MTHVTDAQCSVYGNVLVIGLLSCCLCFGSARRSKMYRKGVFFAATLHAVRSQPTGCSEESHCPIGSYCDTEQMFCQVCLQCKDYMRQAPTNKNCVTSITDCGPCLKGFTEEKSSYLLKCVSPELLPSVPSHGWVIIIATLLTVGLLISIAVAFLLRNFKAYKLFTAIRTVERQTEEDGVADVELLPPPPYNTVTATAPSQGKAVQDGISPQIEPVASCSETNLESDRLQTARVFNSPIYNCNDSSLPSYEIAAQREEIESAGFISANTISAPTPDHNQNIEATPGNRSNPSLSLTNTDSSKKSSSQDSGESFESGGSREECAFFPQNLCIINVIRNNTTVQQQNDLKL